MEVVSKANIVFCYLYPWSDVEGGGFLGNSAATKQTEGREMDGCWLRLEHRLSDEDGK